MSRRSVADSGWDESPIAASWGGRLALLRQAWVLMLLAGLPAIVAYYLLPDAPFVRAVLYCSIPVAAAVAAIVAVVRSSGRTRLVWVFIAAEMVLTAGAETYSYSSDLVGQPLPFPSLADVLWLASYPCFAAALWVLAKVRTGTDQGGNLLDALIVVGGGAMLMWTLFIEPVVDSGELAPLAHAVAIAYPVMDLVLLAMLVRLLVGARRHAAVGILAGSAVTLLAADMSYATILAQSTFDVGGAVDLLWMLSYLLVAVASAHPSARTFSTAPPEAGYRLTPGRLVFLGGALMVGPILLATGVEHAALIATLSIATFVLVMVRMSWLNVRFAHARHDVDRKTDELRHQALHDALTGLPNRALVLDRIDQVLARSQRHGTIGAALFVDLDGFKNVNDTFGHDAGDKLLQAVASRLSACMRDTDTIGRMGGDEFVVLVDDVTLDCAPELVAERILHVLVEPFDLEQVKLPISITASVGIATGLRATAGELLRDADVALYQAKAAGKNCYEVFQPEMKTTVQRRYELEFDLRHALAEDQFRLMYQPIYNLDDLQMMGFEALLRWESPTRGLVSPAEFVPVLESSGQIIEVGRWVLRTACIQMAKWRSAGSDLVVSVNVSGRQLDRDSVIEHVREALEESGLDPTALTLEVTETMLMRNVDATADRLRVLKSLGVQIAIDDFGTGYSSLAYLQRLPVDCLKIDRTFTDAIARSPESDALVHTLVQLGKDLGLRTLAEGVETKAQIDHLRSEQVNEVQGFLLARPLTVDAVEHKLLHQETPAMT